MITNKRMNVHHANIILPLLLIFMNQTKITNKKFLSRIFILSLILILSFSVLTAQNRDDGSVKWPKDFFPILPWDFLGFPEYSLKDAADCNFTIAGFVRPYDLHRVEGNGLKAIIDLDLGNWTGSMHRRKWRDLSDDEIDAYIKKLVANAGKSDAILGYFIADEPSVLDFPFLGKAVEAVKKYAPGKLAYINLFPNYATLSTLDQMDSQLGTKSYMEYLERYVSEVNPQFISYDNYMTQYSRDLKNKKRITEYFNNLLNVREVALKYGLPYWHIVSSNQVRKYTTIPSLPNMMFQAYTSLAAGFDGISWYQFTQRGYDYSPIDNNQRKTPTYFYLKEVNRQILSLGLFLSNCESTGVYFSQPPSGSSLPSLPGEIVDSIKSEEPLMIGEFKDAENNKYVMIVNLSVERSVSFSFSTKSGREKVYLVTPVEKGMEPVLRDRDINNHKNIYWLTAGEGVLIKLES